MKPRIEPKFAAITFAVVAVILYVSLFPFRYQPGARQVWSYFLASLRYRADRFDFFANILLYLPVGFFFAAAFRGVRIRYRVLAAALFGAVLSLAVELLQVYDATRASSVWDFLANADGALLGAVAGASSAAFSAATFPVVMILCWVGYRAALHWAPGIEVEHFVSVFEGMAAWLGCALLLEPVVTTKRTPVVLAALIALVVAMQIWLRGNFDDHRELMAGVVAWFVWAVLLRFAARTAAVAIVFALFVAVEALSPFRFADTGNHFGMLPFLAMIHSSRESLVASTFSKVFMYGTLVWATVRAGWPLGRAAIAATAFVLLLRMIQVYIPGRSAEITDAIMVLLMAGGIYVMRPRTQQPA